MTAKKAAKTGVKTAEADVNEKKATKARASSKAQDAETAVEAVAAEPKKRGRKPKAAAETAKAETSRKASFDEDDVGDIEADIDTYQSWSTYSNANIALKGIFVDETPAPYRCSTS